MNTPILYDTHMHTPLCKHAHGEPEAYAEQALKKGFKGIVMTDHSPMNISYSAHLRMDVNQFDAYLAMVERARRSYEGRLDVRLGIESDYFPGAESWLSELHDRAEFDYILGSVHPQMAEYQQWYYQSDMLDFHRTYYAHMAQAAETGLFDCIAHPDVIKFVHPRDFKPQAILDDIRAALDRIAAAGVAMELNTSGLNKAPFELYPSRTILYEMFVRDIPVVVGSDSHDPKRVGADFEKAFDALQNVGYQDVHFYLRRERQAVSIDAARASLKMPAGFGQMVMDFAGRFI
jgi:histidinol-phosphatase (PHP family)